MTFHFIVTFATLFNSQFWDLSIFVLQVVSIKAIGIAIKLTLEGISQVAYPQTWFFITVAAVCVITQLNYLNKASLTLSVMEVL